MQEVVVDGDRRVPYFVAYSGGDFKVNLGRFAKPWNDDNVLLCFCN